MSKSIVRLLVLILGLMGAAHADQYNWQIGVTASGGIDGAGTLGYLPFGGGCSATDAYTTVCSGSNYVGSGQDIFVGILPGGSTSDPSTWETLLHVVPGTMTLYTGNTEDYVGLLTSFGIFPAGIDPSLYGYYLSSSHQYSVPFGGGDSGVISIYSPYYSVEIYAPAANETPEPGSLFLLGSGLLGIGGAVRRKLIA